MKCVLCSFMLMIVGKLAWAGGMTCSDPSQSLSYRVKYDADGSPGSYHWELSYKGKPSKGGYKDASKVDLKTPWNHLPPSVENGIVYDNFTCIAKVNDETENVICRTAK